MRITLLETGKTETDYLQKGIDVYARRIKHYLPFDEFVIPALKNTRHLSEAQQKQKEGLLLLDYLKPGDELILLDERGDHFDSVGFAAFLEKKMIAGTRSIVFAVGGPYGFSEEVYARAQFKLSLSEMTFSHQLVRLIFVEQLYRAMAIIKGEPYHHG
ncbi:MAG TPA: 23S rRNA (pseudouridine(1915)-N(3))-methyltransferase RlmH [Prolixibacteraceae bacterium]|nr:23S rRNA (pseudouridine(1915)-N(3))-methyltransferase RlmH [Prolixibacteraceae bacterium]